MSAADTHEYLDQLARLVEEQRRRAAAGGKRDQELLALLAQVVAADPKLLDELLFRAEWLRYAATRALKLVPLVTGTESEHSKALVIAPCPHCGGRGRLTRVHRTGSPVADPEGWAHSVRCDSCAAQGGWSKGPRDGRAGGKAGAIRQWNMRAP